MTAGKFRIAMIGVAASAVLLTGCTASGWEPEAPPAAGTQTQLPTLEKVRNVMFVVDGSGDGVLLGSITSVEPSEVVGISYAAEQPDGSFGSESAIDFSTQIDRHGSVKLEGPELAVNGSELTPGRLASVTFQFGGNSQLSLQVPVYDAQHADFQEAWSAAIEG